jgi:MYXO-CTERM domain-containing protein
MDLMVGMSVGMSKPTRLSEFVIQHIQEGKRMNAFFVSSCAAVAVASAASAGFTGFTAEKIVTAAGNSQYSVFANFDSAGLPSGKSWVFLNVYNYQGVSGSMNAIHQDAAEDVDGNPTSSWSASANLLGATARDNDSWVSASGSGTSAGADASLDPSFNNTIFDRIVGSGGGAGWFDATPGTQNLVAAGGASGFRIKLIQFVRSGNEAGGVAQYTGSMSITYKVQDSAAPLTGTGTFSVPAPGAVALAGLAGLMGRRRR